MAKDITVGNGGKSGGVADTRSTNHLRVDIHVKACADAHAAVDAIALAQLPVVRAHQAHGAGIRALKRAQVLSDECRLGANEARQVRRTRRCLAARNHRGEHQPQETPDVAAYSHVPNLRMYHCFITWTSAM